MASSSVIDMVNHKAICYLCGAVEDIQLTGNLLEVQNALDDFRDRHENVSVCKPKQGEN